MKKVITGLLLLSFIYFICGCNDTNNDRINIVTTIFPEYSWVSEITGDVNDDINIEFLLENGTSMHNYEPNVSDIAKISGADLFIYVGGESDSWVSNVLENKTNDEMIVLNLLSILSDYIKEEEIIEGMESNDEEEIEYDEHVWLSVKNVKIICKAIYDAILEIDIQNKDDYQSNYEEYINKLDTLDTNFQDVVNASTRNTILFADRFPLRYLVDDYNIRYYAAFPGCSSETEASTETIVFLVNKVNEEELTAICVMNDSDKRMANTIISSSINKNQKIIVFYSMESVNKNDLERKITYLDLMELNLEALREALN